mgnify:CR=1 FL=1
MDKMFEQDSLSDSEIMDYCSDYELKYLTEKLESSLQEQVIKF